MPDAASFPAPGPAVILLLALVGLVAGLVDAIAGGGGVLTLPALLAARLPPHLALGTNKGCSTFGTAMATLTFARRGRLQLTRTLFGFSAGALGAFLAEVDEWLLHIGARVAELERRHWMHRSREDALLAGAAMVVSPRRMQAPGRVL